LRKRIFEIVEVTEGPDFWGKAYDYTMIVAIIASLVPLAFKDDNIWFFIIDKVAVTLFIIDYILRLITADLKYGEKSVKSFVRYPFSPFGIIDLISILPSILEINDGFKVLRMMRVLRVLRVFKMLRYSKSLSVITAVLSKQKTPLAAVGTMAVGYIMVSALVIFNVEPDSFNTFFDAVYWACISLTTVGYGDIYPVTLIGRIATMVSSIFGIAIVALPAGIITAGYMDEINSRKAKESGADSP
jgi:voltage-gated potassium channel